MAVATLDGKAYYKITTLLKKIGLPYENLSPGESVGPNVRLVLSTRDERSVIPFEKVACIEDLGDDPDIAKEKIFAHLYGSREDILVVGIDPGERIGFASFYQQREIDSGVLASVDEVIEKVTRYVINSPAKKKIVRIGDGKPDLAQKIAYRLLDRLKDVEVELVDERGTSTLTRNISSRRSLRDQRSARIIAFRQGRHFTQS